jgi:cation diffusion facilitator family transporter
MTEESRSTVLAAMGANFAIGVGKLTAGLITGSAALLAEAGHSIADTVNQVFLLIGLNLARNEADEAHPHGYGKEGFFWSFLAAVFIFVAGATFSFYEGIRTVAERHSSDRSGGELLFGFGVLGMAFVFESFSFLVAVRSLRSSARARAWSFAHYIRHSPDLTTKTVFWEDSAALVGLLLAAVGLGMSELSGSEHWDGGASILIGCVLVAAALILGMQARNLLLGAAAGADVRDEISRTVEAFPEVRRIVRLLTMQLGVHSILVTGELHVRRDLTTAQIEELMVRIDSSLATHVPEVSDTFWELRHAPNEDAVTGGSDAVS